jgi:glycosyltransferase involved in cell wall biosynthesis
MAIHAISLIKNEADIIEWTLAAAVRWCDHIYVFDNGSTDGTWEKVQVMAKEFTQIVPWKQDPKPFTDGLRAEVFRNFSDRAKPGDWWCILDADEIYIDDPAEFLAPIPDCYESVWHQHYTYLFTDEDAEEYARDPQEYEKVPAPDRLRYYVLSEYSEPRFVRHMRGRRSHPVWHRHPIYPRRIKLRHYGYRSPQQITRRLETRREPMLRGEFIHEKRSNWQPGGFALPGPAAPSDLPGGWEERIVPSEGCHLDTGVESLLPPRPWESDVLMSPSPRRVSEAGRLKRLARRVAQSLSWTSVPDGSSTLKG